MIWCADGKTPTPPGTRRAREGSGGFAAPLAERLFAAGACEAARASFGIAPRILYASGRLAAHADRAASAASVYAGFHPPALHGFFRAAWRPRVWGRSGDCRRLRALSWPAGAGDRAPEGARYQAARGAQFRAGQARGLPQGSALDETRGQIPAADFYR